MTTLALTVSILLTVALAPFFLFLAAITAAASIGARRRSNAPHRRTRFLILIPAHDEQGAIASTVESCLALRYDRDLFAVFVIADNCSDDTAKAAREAGASVVERTTADLRSKGHALEYFFTQVPQGRLDAGHDAFVLIDADTVVDPDLLDVFDRAVGRGWDWVQGYYTVRNPEASWRTRMMTYAFSLANGVWMLGLDRLSLGVGLKGNGMCFSATGLRRVPWKAYGLVEDMEFALLLRTRGERVRFDPEARVYGEMVSQGGAGAESQRRRWEAGRRSLPGKFAGPLVRSTSLGVYRKACYLLDLYFPPLVTLALTWFVAAGASTVAAFDPRVQRLAVGFLTIQAMMLIALSLYAFSPVHSMKLPARYLASLIALPYYAVWKLRLKLGKAPVSWVRTPREVIQRQDDV